jgi:CBS domain-containing protein
VKHSTGALQVSFKHGGEGRVNAGGVSVARLSQARRLAWFALHRRKLNDGAIPMTIGEICNRIVVFAHEKMSLSDAAKLMREHHVGSLVVVKEDDPGRTPTGIITDRDIVVEVVAEGIDHKALTVGEIMGGELVTAREQDNMLDVLQLMRRRGIRRVPVVTASGSLAGIVTIDDLLEIVAEELDDVVKAIASERQRETRARP